MNLFQEDEAEGREMEKSSTGSSVLLGGAKWDDAQINKLRMAKRREGWQQHDDGMHLIKYTPTLLN